MVVVDGVLAAASVTDVSASETKTLEEDGEVCDEKRVVSTWATFSQINTSHHAPT